MSVLGDLIRLSPALREELQADPATVYDRVTSFGGPERIESYRVRLAERYDDLTSFYSAAARHGECTIFWAA